MSFGKRLRRGNLLGDTYSQLHGAIYSKNNKSETLFENAWLTAGEVDVAPGPCDAADENCLAAQRNGIFGPAVGREIVAGGGNAQVHAAQYRWVMI
jgi:hypothetical protein